MSLICQNHTYLECTQAPTLKATDQCIKQKKLKKKLLASRYQH